MELYELSLREQADGVKSQKFSAEQLFDSCVNHAISLESKIGAFITLTLEEGREAARRMDKSIAAGKPVGKLAGVPFGAKDNMVVRGIQATAGSKMLSGWVPPYTASAIEFLCNEGAVLMGKMNMDEFAMGSSTESSAFGCTSNPWDTSRVPGGSSGGSAAGVAAGYFPFSLGSDTGGSIRLPAAFCGVQGLKPTYGMVSRYGLIAYGSSLDQIGPMTRNLDDLALVMQVISAHDDRDSTSVSSCHNIDFSNGKAAKRVGFVKEFKDFKIDPAIKAAEEEAVKALKAAGVEMVEVSLPIISKYALACYYAVAVSEANTNLARFDGARYGYAVKDAVSLTDFFTRSRSEGFGVEVKRRILAGTFLTDPYEYDKYYTPALKVRHLIAEEFEKAFSQVDCILQPGSPTLAFKKGEKTKDSMLMYASDMYTIPVNLAGIPSLAVNAGYSDGLPVGLQLVGKRWSDADLIATGKVLEARFGAPKIAKGGA